MARNMINTSRPALVCGTENATIDEEAVATLIANNTTRPFSADAMLQIDFGGRSPDVNSGICDTSMSWIRVYGSAQNSAVHDEETCNFILAHELKHYIDNHESSLFRERLLYYARKEGGTAAAMGLGIMASVYASRDKFPKKYAVGVAAGSAVLAAMRVKKHWQHFFASYEERLSAYQALPWEKRANDFAEQHKHDGLIKLDALE